jgi:hypothetical protein
MFYSINNKNFAAFKLLVRLVLLKYKQEEEKEKMIQNLKIIKKKCFNI